MGKNYFALLNIENFPEKKANILIQAGNNRSDENISDEKILLSMMKERWSDELFLFESENDAIAYAESRVNGKLVDWDYTAQAGEPQPFAFPPIWSIYVVDSKLISSKDDISNLKYFKIKHDDNNIIFKSAKIRSFETNNDFYTIVEIPLSKVPTTYRKIVEPYFDVRHGIQKLLEDYTPSKTSSFFKGHWNRHHSDLAKQLINTIELQKTTGEDTQKILMDARNNLMKDRTTNLSGSMMRRLNYAIEQYDLTHATKTVTP